MLEMTALVPMAPALPAPALSPEVVLFQEQIRVRAEELRRKSKSDSTRRAYHSDMRQFRAWCLFMGKESLPASPMTVAEYLSAMTVSKTARGKEYATSTIGRRIAAIAHFHCEAGLPDPSTDERVKAVMSGIARENAGKANQQKGALVTKHIRKGLRGEMRKPQDFRDRCLVLIGFAAALRRSELIGLDYEHITIDDENRMCIRLLRSKTNQTGQLEEVWVLPAGEHCPVKAYQSWIGNSGITAGPVFRGVNRHGQLGKRLSTEAVPYIVKRVAKRAGLDPKLYSGHSLRSGHVTTAFQAEVPIALVQQQTRHRDINSLMRYYRRLEPQKHNSSSHLGL